MSLAKKLKMIIKGEPKPTFGTDPNEPWSARAGITESVRSRLSAYLKSRGINPEFISRSSKIGHAKSMEFAKWKRDHNFDDPADSVSSTTRDKMIAQREETLSELDYDTVKSLYKKRRDDFHGPEVGKTKKGKEVSAKNVSRSISRLTGFKPTQNQPQKEEIVNEISKDKVEKYLSKVDDDDYKKHGTKPNMYGRLSKQRQDGVGRAIDRLAVKSEETILETKKLSAREKFLSSLKRNGLDVNARAKEYEQIQKNIQSQKQKNNPNSLSNEDVYQDSQAATQTAFDMGTTPNQTEPTHSRKKEMSKSARIIKSLYKHNNMKEEIYDHEKEDKSVATYGKKPKVERVGVDGDEDSQAAMVLKGGKTLTGQERDTLEIDPVMRKPTNPDNKNSNKKLDK